MDQYALSSNVTAPHAHARTTRDAELTWNRRNCQQRKPPLHPPSSMRARPMPSAPGPAHGLLLLPCCPLLSRSNSCDFCVSHTPHVHAVLCCRVQSAQSLSSLNLLQYWRSSAHLIGCTLLNALSKLSPPDLCTLVPQHPNKLTDERTRM
jgi:hypothetical protein